MFSMRKKNRHDKHVMAVYWDEELLVVVGHLPQEIAEMCFFFTQSTKVKSCEK